MPVHPERRWKNGFLMSLQKGEYSDDEIDEVLEAIQKHKNAGLTRFTKRFLDQLFSAIISKYQSKKPKTWKPQPGIEMEYRTIKGYDQNSVKQAIIQEAFKITELKIIVGECEPPLKFVLKDFDKSKNLLKGADDL